MGDEYALVCDKTKEAYELGRGRWYEWAPKWGTIPSSKEEVLSFIKEWLKDTAWRPEDPDAWAERVATAAWDFIVGHPGCRVSCDTYAPEIYWSKEPWEETYDDFIFYRQVGSRYDDQTLTRKAEDERPKPDGRT